MRKSFVIVVIALSMGLAIPALADPPVTETFTFTLTEVNPCSPTGENHDVTITLVDRTHFEHQQNFVLHSYRSGTTSSGFVMVEGNGHNMIGEENVLVGGFTDVWWNRTTEERYITSGTLVFNANTGTVQVSRDSARCLGA